MRKTNLAESLPSECGSQIPRIRIAPNYDATELRAVKLLKAGGLLLDPWQTDILEDWMALTPGKKWKCKTCGGSVPRQNGKTGLIQARSESGMLLYAERVLYTAHLQKTATETFEEMADFFDKPILRKHVKDIKTALTLQGLKPYPYTDEPFYGN